MRHAVLLLLCLSALSCTPAPNPKPWKPAPLPIGPKPVIEADAGPEQTAKVVGEPVAATIPDENNPPPKEGNFGWKPDAKASQEFLNTLPARTLFEANPELREPPKVKPISFQEPTPKEPTLLYRALYKVQPGWQVGSQGIGDCVSWGWAHGVDISLAVDKVTGRTSEWKPAATEAIYGGSRVEARGRKTGGYSDGSYGAAAAKWVKDWGVIWRQQYTTPAVDLTTYSSSRAKQWGNFGCGGEGDNGALDEQAKKFPATQVAQVRSFAEAAAAIESGYPVPVCSGQGFSSTRDAQGFSPARGAWAHCMNFCGVRYNPNGLLCLNSWGTKWISGPKWPDDQPDGSFWVSEATATRMLSAGDSFAVSHIKGFPKRALRHDLGW